MWVRALCNENISGDEAMELCVNEAAQLCIWGCAPNWEHQCSPEEDESGWDFGESIVPDQASLLMALSAKISHWDTASAVWKCQNECEKLFSLKLLKKKPHKKVIVNDFMTIKYMWAAWKDCTVALMAVQVFVVGFQIYCHYLFTFFDSCREEIRNTSSALCLTASLLHVEIWVPQCPARPQPQKSLRLAQDHVQRSICSHLKQCYLRDVGKERFGKPEQKYSKYCICLCNLAKFSKCKSS